MLNSTKANTAMVTSLKQKLKQHIIRHPKFQNFRKDEEGVAAIEFSIVALLLITLYIGLYEIALAYQAKGALTQSAVIASSFPTFELDLDETKLSDVMTAAAAVVQFPRSDPDKLTIRLYSLEEAPNGELLLVGQTSYNETSANAAGVGDLTQDDFNNINVNLDPGKGLVVAQVVYNYDFILSSRFIDGLVLQDIQYFNPRKNQGESLELNTSDGSYIRADFNCLRSGTGVGVYTCNASGITFPDPEVAGAD